MFSGQDESDKIADRYIETRGRSFKLVCADPHGYWKVYHARNNKPCVHLPGEYTSLNEAIKAVQSLPEDKLPVIEQRKTVLTPKGVKKRIEDEESED